MPTRSAKARWNGSIQEGQGTITLKVGEYPYSAKTRMTEGEQDIATTNPEELVGAALAGCYNMALSTRLSVQGHPPQSIETECKVTLSLSGLGMKVSQMVLVVRAVIPDMSAEDFEKHAQIAKDNCPISNALAAVPIRLEPILITEAN